MEVDMVGYKIKQIAEEEETCLDFGRWQITELPAEAFQLTQLTHLRLERNQLTSIPPEIGLLTNLEQLSLHDNHLSALPPEIGRLTRLKVLELEHNELAELPSDIGNLINLKSLSLDDNKLTALPAEICRLVNLRKLGLGNNELTLLPPGIENLENLDWLNVGGNRLTELPREIGRLIGLTELPLQDNQLTALPSEIAQLVRLVTLSLENNRLTELPAEIGGLFGLMALSLESNQLTELPRQIGRLTNLRKLLLANNQLTALPSECGSLIYLRSLTLENNRLTRLPSEIGQLTCLTELSVQGNQLAALPSEIGNLIGLESLPLQDNNLSRLPSEIGQLVNLKTLSLENNHLTTVPPEIGQLVNLESLSLQNNQLTELPAKIGELVNLQSLLLQNNRLAKLPQEVARLKKLKTLCLRDDQLFPLPLTSRIREWDVFISHASEDMEDVALPLFRALTAAGLKVWIDKQEIMLGDSIREKIDAGLAKSRFAVVILSQRFMDKMWTARELNGLLAIEDEGEKVVLPVWHNISKEVLTRYSPILSDRLAANTQDGIPAVASQIIDVVMYRAADTPSSFFPNLTHRFVQLIRDTASPADVRDFLIQHPRIIVQALGMAQRLETTLSPRLLGQQVPAIIVKFVTPANYSIKEDRTTYLMFASPDTRLLREESTAFKSTSNVPGFEFGTGHTMSAASLPAGATSGGDADFEAKATSRGNPLLESARRIVLNEQEEWVDAFIVTGRRHELSEADRARMKDFNEANEYIPRGERERPLKVRTYDWLIDACVELDKNL
jgi:Leucine-rich repeat (LRR) protein